MRRVLKMELFNMNMGTIFKANVLVLHIYLLWAYQVLSMRAKLIVIIDFSHMK